MPIIDIQQRTRELGRIRIGQTQPTKSGGTRPAKLDRFRLTSASRPLLDQVAELYGGTVQEWTPANGGPAQWEVVTDAARLPVMVPPQSVSQWYELWSGGGCQRRCDGEREVLTDSACPCGPDPAARECKPTTRLNVVLRDVPGVGVWRLESHGYYAAVELPAVADMLAQTSGYIQAWLALEERTAKRDGQTRRWMVPTLEVDITPSQLMAGEGGVAPSVASGQEQAPAVAGAQAPALESGAEARSQQDLPPRNWHADVDRARTTEALRDLWREASAAGALDEDLKALLAEKVDMVRQIEQTGAYTPSTGKPTQLDEPSEAPAQADTESDRDAVWTQIVTAWQGTTSQLEDAYARTHQGEVPEGASAEQLRQFLDDIRGGWITADPDTDSGSSTDGGQTAASTPF